MYINVSHITHPFTAVAVQSTLSVTPFTTDIDFKIITRKESTKMRYFLLWKSTIPLKTSRNGD